MRRRRQVAGDVRANLAAKLRRNAETYDRAVFGVVRACAIADRLDRGEAVELSAWQLPRDVRRGFRPNDRVRLQSNGSLTGAAPASPD